MTKESKKKPRRRSKGGMIADIMPGPGYDQAARLARECPGEIDWWLLQAISDDAGCK